MRKVQIEVFKKADFRIESITNRVIELKIVGTNQLVKLDEKNANRFFYGNTEWRLDAEWELIPFKQEPPSVNIEELGKDDYEESMREFEDDLMRDFVKDTLLENNFQETVEILTNEFEMSGKAAYTLVNKYLNEL